MIDTNSLIASLNGWSNAHGAKLQTLTIGSEQIFELVWDRQAGAQGYISVYPQPSGILVVHHGMQKEKVRQTGGVTRWRCAPSDMEANLTRLMKSVETMQPRVSVHTPSPKIDLAQQLKFN